LWQTDWDLRLACLLLFSFDCKDNFWQYYGDFLPSADESTSLLLATEVCKKLLFYHQNIGWYLAHIRCIAFMRLLLLLLIDSWNWRNIFYLVNISTSTFWVCFMIFLRKYLSLHFLCWSFRNSFTTSRVDLYI
jgi:hypothetical protein